MTDIQALVNVLPSLNERDQAFAASLIAQHGKKGLSPKQTYWVGELVKRANTPAKPAETKKVGNVKPILDMLTNAKQHLKNPAVIFRVKDRDLRLSIAGIRARFPGSVNVAGTGTFAERDWFGRINKDGEFEPSPKWDEVTQTSIAKALKALAKNPAKAAAEYGHMTGSCCFCSKTLTDSRSVKVGYGPVCAGHFGLPWGDTAKEAA